jgi:hypothetical protein
LYLADQNPVSIWKCKNKIQQDQEKITAAERIIFSYLPFCHCTQLIGKKDHKNGSYNFKNCNWQCDREQLLLASFLFAMYYSDFSGSGLVRKHQ